MNDLLNNYANNISDKFTIIAKDNDFKQSKFQRYYLLFNISDLLMKQNLWLLMWQETEWQRKNLIK